MKLYYLFRLRFVCHSSELTLQSYRRLGAILFSCAIALATAGCEGGSSSAGGNSKAPPANLSYPVIEANVGVAISPDNPYFTGTVTSFTVSPALPNGFSLNPISGSISGTPSAGLALTQYTVTASNSFGSDTAALQITVSPIPPNALAYAQAIIGATVGAPITPDTAMVNGTVTSFTINPALPAGLSIDATSGAISGTPTATSAPATYTVTASNAGGSTTAQIQVTVGYQASTLAFLGHAASIQTVLTNGTNVLTEDISGHWVLWSYANSAVIASGGGAVLQLATGGTTNNGIGLAGATAVVWDGSNANIFSTSSGQEMATVPASCWYRLATDGSYVATASSSALTVYSSAGTQEFTESGNYCAANVFATPTQVQVALGAKGNNVIENLAVPTGTSTVSPSYNGTFNSWFTDGSRFLSNVSSTVLTYSETAVQQGILNLPSTYNNTFGNYLAGQGNWISVVTDSISGSTLSSALNIYAVGSSTPTETYALANGIAPNIAVSGMEEAITAEYSQQMSVIDLSGSTPTKNDYTLPAPLYPEWVNPAYVPATFAASSASTWLLACNNSAIFDGGSINSTPRTLNYGNALSIVAAGSTAAVSTESGQILVFDLSASKPIGNIPFYANKLQISSDGSVLAAADLDITGQPIVTLNFYSLPSMKLSGTLTWDSSSQPYLTDFNLSGSSTEVGELIFANTNATAGTAELIHPDGSANVVLQQGASAAPLLSPDGTLAAVTIPPSFVLGNPPATNIYKNGALGAAVATYAEGWVDNNDLLGADFELLNQMGNPGPTYTGSTIYDASGNAVTEFAQTQLPATIYGPLSFIPGGFVYAPDYASYATVGSSALTNSIFSLTSGDLTFQGPLNSAGIGAAGASDIVYETTNGIVTMVPFQ